METIKLKENLTPEEKILEEKISDALSSGVAWYKIKTIIMQDLGEEDFKILYKSKVMNTYLGLVFNNPWVKNSILSDLFGRYTHLAHDILKTSIDGPLKVFLIEQGYHRGIKDINDLAYDDNPDIRQFAAQRCDIETLKKLRKDSEKKIRLQAYKRLGVDEYLDEMMDDKNYEVRLLAVRAAPFYYEKFKDMSGELSLKVFKEIARKIDTKHIPYILGNRNTKNKYVKELLGQRLSKGNIDFSKE